MESIPINGCAQTAEIGELMKALAAAQSEMGFADKDSNNPHFKSSYADLASVYRACKTSLAKQQLAVAQVLATRDDKVVCYTTLGHSSGQWMRSELELRPSKSDVQGCGSAFTYARRYSLAAMVGVAPDDDDDGNEAARPAGKQVQKSQAQTEKSSQTASQPTKLPSTNFGDKERVAMMHKLVALILQVDPVHRVPKEGGEPQLDRDASFSAAQLRIGKWREEDVSVCAVGADGKPSIQACSKEQLAGLLVRYQELAGDEFPAEAA